MRSSILWPFFIRGDRYIGDHKGERERR